MAKERKKQTIIDLLIEKSGSVFALSIILITMYSLVIYELYYDSQLVGSIINQYLVVVLIAIPISRIAVRYNVTYMMDLMRVNKAEVLDIRRKSIFLLVSNHIVILLHIAYARSLPTNNLHTFMVSFAVIVEIVGLLIYLYRTSFKLPKVISEINQYKER